MFHIKSSWSDEKIRREAEIKLKKMTLREKVFLLSGNWHMIRDSIKYKRSYNPVPIESHGNKRLGVKPIAFTDGPRGVVMGQSTCFPVSMARAASFDRELEREIGEAIGKEARAQGANYFGGVCVNLLMHPAGGRAQESYGEDPFLVGEMGAQLVKGVQKHNVMACAKHYALNNMENLRFHINVDCDERTLREVYLPQFKKCVDAGCASLMGSYNRFRDDQASESRYLLTDILRGEWGFEGFTITDFIFALRDGAKAIEAGMDVEMPIPVHFGLELKKAVKEERLEEEVIDRAVLRLLSTQMAFEQAEDPMVYGKSLVACPEHIALARRAAEESMVLLKNEGDVLPLSEDIRKILVIGHLADQPNTGDHGSSSVYPPHVVTILQGIRERTGEKGKVIHVDEGDIDRIRKLAPKADAVIVVAGNDYNDEGEFVMPDRELDPTQLMGQGFTNNGHPLLGKLMGQVKSDGKASSYTSADNTPVGGDRRSLSLRESEITAIREAGAGNRNTIVVLVSGSMVMTREWEDAAGGILYAWYAGMEGGHTVADILWGKVNPSGKLPFTIPKEESHLPEVDFFGADRITYDYYHGYRKLDKEGHEAAYPFGYGLSYTDFSFSEPVIKILQDLIRVETDVTNIGGRSGDEVVQVYVSVPESKVERHKKELKGFARVLLEPGEQKHVEIDIPLEELKYYDPEKKEWVLEKTKYLFGAGTSSQEEMIKWAKSTIERKEVQYEIR